jgi:CDP-diacylglycerol--glycerol-3-phosphate 3-phosphatidyltransferase
MEAQRLTLSNRITILRILTIPLFALAVIYYLAGAGRGEPSAYLRWGSMVVFLLAGLSDALDGYFARSRNERTRLGTVLDPLADKGLLLCALILLSGPWGRVFEPHIPIWYVLMVISRDVILIVGSVVIHFMAGHVVVQPRLSGKASTVLQMIIIVWVLAQGEPTVMSWLLGAATVFTLLSTAVYILDGVRQLERTYGHDNPASRS